MRALLLGVLMCMSTSGCGSRATASGALVGLGVVAVVAGALMAGDCKGSPSPDGSGVSCSGHPRRSDTNGGLIVAATGMAMVAAGMALDESAGGTAQVVSSTPPVARPLAPGPRVSLVQGARPRPPWLR